MGVGLDHGGAIVSRLPFARVRARTRASRSRGGPQAAFQKAAVVALACRLLHLSSVADGHDWFLVAANYVIHMVVRETAWSTPVVIAGHAITAVQMVAFAQCVHTHPGSPPPGWGTAAQPTGYWTTCVVEGVPLPPRAFYVRRLGEAILGFDHFCWWLGVPVGWRNRKFFVQFVLWSSVLSGFALVL